MASGCELNRKLSSENASPVPSPCLSLARLLTVPSPLCVGAEKKQRASSLSDSFCEPSPKATTQSESLIARAPSGNDGRVALEEHCMSDGGSGHSLPMTPPCCSPRVHDGALYAEVRYALDSDSDSLDSDIDGVLELEEIYRFDQDRLYELARQGAGFTELVEAAAAGMADSFESFLTTEQAQRAAESGDGTLEHVGLKVHGSQQCPHCSQRFDTRRQLQVHDKFVHEAQRQPHEALLHRAVAAARRQHRRSIANAVRAPSPATSSPRWQSGATVGVQSAARVQQAIFRVRRRSMLAAASTPQADASVDDNASLSLMSTAIAKSRRRRLSMP